MKPGIRVASPRSITLAFAGTLTEPAGPTAVIVLSVTTMTALLIAAAPVPSIKRAALRTTVPFPIGGSGVIRAGVCAKTGAAPRTRHNTTLTSFKFLTVLPFDWCVRQREMGIAVPNAAVTYAGDPCGEAVSSRGWRGVGRRGGARGGGMA